MKMSVLLRGSRDEAKGSEDCPALDLRDLK